MPSTLLVTEQERDRAPDAASLDEVMLEDHSEGALTEVLTKFFYHTAFRGSQLAVVQRLLQGQSALAIMPTGAKPCKMLLRKTYGLHVERLTL